MKKIISILLISALILTLSLALISCEGNEEETEHNIIIEGPEGEDENETVKKPDGTYESENWELGEVPLH